MIFMQLYAVQNEKLYTGIMQVMEFVRRHVGTYSPLLAGNSVYVDFLFLKVSEKKI